MYIEPVSAPESLQTIFLETDVIGGTHVVDPTYPVALLEEHLRHAAAYETRGAGHKDMHDSLLIEIAPPDGTSLVIDTTKGRSTPVC